ncbi:hypothetical protein KAR91_05005 [Candidatus Pacearchaeota archaeon]|nr:hypothetical protein [Candidatus Pacearchaeota archaeon]
MNNLEIKETHNLINRCIMQLYVLLACLVIFVFLQFSALLDAVQICAYSISFAILFIVLPKNVKEGIYEDSFSLRIIGVGLILRVFLGKHFALSYIFSNVYVNNFLDGFFGMLISGGLLYFGVMFLEFIFKKEIAGGGDIKIAAAIGVIIGTNVFWYASFFVLILGFMQLMWYLPVINKIDCKIEIIPSVALHGLALSFSLLGVTMAFNAPIIIGMILFLGLTLFISQKAGVLDIEQGV